MIDADDKQFERRWSSDWAAESSVFTPANEEVGERIHSYLQQLQDGGITQAMSNLRKVEAKRRKWAVVVAVGLAAVVAGAGLIIGGVVTSNPLLVIIGVITAIAGMILICVALKKYKDANTACNRISVSLTDNPQFLQRTDSNRSLPLSEAQEWVEGRPLSRDNSLDFLPGMVDGNQTSVGLTEDRWISEDDEDLREL